MEKIIEHFHYVVIKTKPISSHEILINTRLKDKVNIVQKFQQTVRIGVCTKQILKKYIEGEFNYKKKKKN